MIDNKQKMLNFLRKSNQYPEQWSNEQLANFFREMDEEEVAEIIKKYNQLDGRFMLNQTKDMFKQITKIKSSIFVDGIYQYIETLKSLNYRLEQQQSQQLQSNKMTLNSKQNSIQSEKILYQDSIFIKNENATLLYPCLSFDNADQFVQNAFNKYIKHFKKLTLKLRNVNYQQPQNLTTLNIYQQLFIGRDEQELNGWMSNLQLKNQPILLINDGTISRKHCSIYSKGFNFYALDNKSTSGTYLKIINNLKLYENLIIEIGQTQALFKDIINDEQKKIFRFKVYLSDKEGKFSNEKEIIYNYSKPEKVITLGRFSDNDIEIHDVYVSKQNHAVIRYKQEENSLYICDDLKVGNGIHQKLFGEHQLKHDDIIKFSDNEYQIILHY